MTSDTQTTVLSEVFLNTPKPRISSRTLLLRYAEGERAFGGTNLSGIALSHAKLAGVDLTGVSLQSATLQGADLEGATLIDADLTLADLAGANLASADLSRADLTRANLMAANLEGANLPRAGLVKANLTRADLSGASATRANFTRANLRGALLVNANLHYAFFEEANLTHANLAGANVAGAEFARALLNGTILANLDLSPFCETDPDHLSPSIVDPASIQRSLLARGLREFLPSTGMQEVFAEYMVDCARSLDPEGVFKMLRSTFISYGQPDEPFARMLYEALHRNGVVTFFFPEHARPGDKLHRTMRKGISEHDRVILVCSRSSLEREGVVFEIEEALTRESKMKGEPLLIPIRLDRYVLDEWQPEQKDLADAVRSRVVADFEDADCDPAKFQSALLKLIGALKK